MLVGHSPFSSAYKSFRHGLVSHQRLWRGPPVGVYLGLVVISCLLLTCPISSSASDSSLLDSLSSSTLFRLRVSGVEATFYAFLPLFFFFLDNLEDFLASFEGVLTIFLKLFMVSWTVFLTFFGVESIS
jgi:hypothetical protein